MSYFYVNANNPGDVTELEERSARLDNLPNWAAYDTREQAEQGGDEQSGYVIEQGVLTRKGMVAAPTIAPRRDDDVPAPATTARKAAKASDRVGDDEGDDDGSPSPTPRSARHGR